MNTRAVSERKPSFHQQYDPRRYPLVVPIHSKGSQPNHANHVEPTTARIHEHPQQTDHLLVW